jgi:U1 small nuclear ribonucleoprotein 70kDa
MASNSNAMRQATPRGQMTRGANSGPAVMLMPPDVRAIFLPNPPLPPVPPIHHRRKHPITGVAQYLHCFENTTPPTRILQPTPQSLAVQKKENKKKLYYETQLAPAIAAYRQEQRETAGSLLFGTMNCYNTLFIGRLAYECTEMKLLRQMEQYGTVKDLRIITMKKKSNDESSSNSSLSRGYAFCEYEHEEDMKRAYRAADGLLVENRPIVVDVERGHTVPDWLPRRLGGGLGMTRPSKEQGKPITRPGRYDPHKPEHVPPPSMANMSRGGPPPMPRGGGGGYGGPPPPSGYGGRDIAERERGDSYYGGTARGGPPPPRMGGHNGPPPPYGAPYGGGGPPYGGGGPPPHRPPPSRGHDNDYPPSRNKRYRSRSPDRYGGGGGSSGGRRRL